MVSGDSGGWRGCAADGLNRAGLSFDEIERMNGGRGGPGSIHGRSLERFNARSPDVRKPPSG